MSKLLAAFVASAFAFGTVSAFSADLTAEDRANMRERASALQTQRVQGREQVRSDVDFRNNRSDVRLSDKRVDGKKVKKTRKVKKTKRGKASVHKTKAHAGKAHAAR